jgi:uncharacterized membrane protein
MRTQAMEFSLVLAISTICNYLPLIFTWWFGQDWITFSQTYMLITFNTDHEITDLSFQHSVLKHSVLPQTSLQDWKLPNYQLLPPL